MANEERTIQQAAKELLDAMETCHICKGVLLLQDSPVRCEDCSGDCEDHEEPECTPIYVLHRNLRKALKDSGERPDLEAPPDVRQMLVDIGILLSELEAHQENINEFLEDDDATLVADIKRRYANLSKRFPAAPAEAVGTQTDWVSVEERLPETPEVVIVAHNNIGRHTYVARYKDGEWVRSDSDRKFYTAGVTHWQPLPEPPNPAAQPEEEK